MSLALFFFPDTHCNNNDYNAENSKLVEATATPGGILIMVVVQAAIDKNKIVINIIGAIVSCTINHSI